jgi:hypothetical protein
MKRIKNELSGKHILHNAKHLGHVIAVGAWIILLVNVVVW